MMPTTNGIICRPATVAGAAAWDRRGRRAAGRREHALHAGALGQIEEKRQVKNDRSRQN
jgi:hypothetical protein